VRVEGGLTPEADLTRALYEQYANQIFRYCLHQLGSREEAEDAVQSTFLNAFRGIKRGVVPELESPWLFKIAHNVCLSRRRTSWRRGRIESPTDFDVVEELTPAPSRRSDELIGLQDVLERLPENQRRAILLREWQGLSYREIAEELELSQSAVETLIFRARRGLASGLEQPPAGKRRVARGADLGNVLAGLKSLLLGGGAAAKVAATVAVVSASTVVAATPIEQHRPHVHQAAKPAAAPSRIVPVHGTSPPSDAVQAVAATVRDTPPSRVGRSVHPLVPGATKPASMPAPQSLTAVAPQDAAPAAPVTAPTPAPPTPPVSEPAATPSTPAAPSGDTKKDSTPAPTGGTSETSGTSGTKDAGSGTKTTTGTSGITGSGRAGAGRGATGMKTTTGTKSGDTGTYEGSSSGAPASTPVEGHPIAATPVVRGVEGPLTVPPVVPVAPTTAAPDPTAQPTSSSVGSSLSGSPGSQSAAPSSSDSTAARYPTVQPPGPSAGSSSTTGSQSSGSSGSTTVPLPTAQPTGSSVGSSSPGPESADSLGSSSTGWDGSRPSRSRPSRAFGGS
jgi:RNA polymerase sigma factor (sigma-70 family)